MGNSYGQLSGSAAEKFLGVDLKSSVSEGLNDFFAKQPQGKQLKKDILTKLSIYAAAPYFVAGLLAGYLLTQYLKKRI
jgi:hypothetical protein